MNRTALITLVAVAPALFLMSGCQSPSHTRKVTAADSGGTIQLSTGDLLLVELESNPTTGYTWQTLQINSWVLARLNRPEFEPAGTGRVGAGGMLTMTYQAVGPGESPLKLGYIRPWESNAAPAKSFDLTVIVK